jgi:hypothetical protein
MSDEFTALRAYHQEWEDRVRWCERALRSHGILPFELAQGGTIVPDVGIQQVSPDERRLAQMVVNKNETENKLLAQIQRMGERIAQLEKDDEILRVQIVDAQRGPR